MHRARFCKSKKRPVSKSCKVPMATEGTTVLKSLTRDRPLPLGRKKPSKKFKHQASSSNASIDSDKRSTSATKIQKQPENKAQSSDAKSESNSSPVSNSSKPKVVHKHSTLRLKRGLSKIANFTGT